MSLLRRLAATFVEPADHPPPAPPSDGARPTVVFVPPRPAPPGAAPLHDSPQPPDPLARAVVLGADAAAIPLAAACAGELRARAQAPAALLCVWQPALEAPADELDPPWDAPDLDEGPSTPAGATTPAARRLSARLAAHDLAATACGRLAWLRLEPEADQAAEQARRCLAISDAPVVIALAGPRAAAFEPLLSEVGTAIAVLPTDTDDPLRELVLSTLPTSRRAVIAPLRPGPPRWAAMAGLGRLRSLDGGEP